jgi:hypothetical protein
MEQMAIPRRSTLGGALGLVFAFFGKSEKNYRNRLVRARSTISSPRPFRIALIIYRLKSTT